MALTNIVHSLLDSLLLDFVKDGQNFTVIISHSSSVSKPTYFKTSKYATTDRGSLATYPFILGFALPYQPSNVDLFK